MCYHRDPPEMPCGGEGVVWSCPTGARLSCSPPACSWYLWAPGGTGHVGPDAKPLVSASNPLFQRSELPHCSCHFTKLLLAAGIAKLRWMVHLHHVWTEPVTLTGHLCPGTSTYRARSVFSQLLSSHTNPDTKPEQQNSPTAFGHWLLNGLCRPRQLGR